jgi:hypothetical protein
MGEVRRWVDYVRNAVIALLGLDPGIDRAIQ